MTNDHIRQNIRTIVRAIKTEEQSLRSRFPILNQQNTIGMATLLVSFSALVGLGSLYYFGLIPAWLCIILAAVVTSISHELEHDLIHNQYFSKQPFWQNFMMLAVWLMRPNTINPWYRRKIHLHHHQHSGTQQDLEERLVGNGIRNPFLRALVIVDGLLGLIINRRRFKKEIKGFSFAEVFNAGFPVTTLYFIVLYSVLAFHGLNLFFPIESSTPAWALSIMQVFEFLMVVLIIPNIIRSSSLNFVTSCMHYYGGVNNLHEQTHVLSSRLFTPFHLFCFNFGRTHTIHHYVPNQPFYIRQFISKKINKVMAENGVRFNDFESIRNANYYSPNT
uniref:fatty acid desaturase n=1 Tax=Ningiella ruwaisensis TaxID=2364274 RepID=UPI0010A00D31|nr:fatty acid desaturase [Ningiella ruwaisensis]